MYSVPMEVMGLEEFSPELLFTKFTGHVLKVLLLHGGVGFEDGFYDIRG